jgi:glycerophosphoryl diester phosphodiesterase
VRPLVFAHRGASARARENTLEAFRLAQELGADGVELDVRRTADGQLVVHHDPEIEGFGLIVAQRFERLRSEHPEVPTLADALGACAGMIVNVEIKCLPWEPDADEPADRPVMRGAVDAARASGAEFIVSSFDIHTVDAARAYAPNATTAWLTGGRSIGEGAKLATEHGHAWLNPDRKMALGSTAADIAAAHESGVRVNVWTVDAPDEVRTLVDIGVDAIITNQPDTVLAALSR